MKNRMMSSLTVSRLLLLFIFLAIVLLLHLALLIPSWYGMIKRIEQHTNAGSHSFHIQLQSEINKTTKLLNVMSSYSTKNLARLVASSLNGSKLSFSEIENSVAPILFQALSINPHLTQISYIGREGVVFSYYTDRNQTFALYSNSSFDISYNSSSPIPPKAYWYTQLVDNDTGKLHGNIVASSPFIAFRNASSLREALKSINGYSFLGTRWNNTKDLLFINTAMVDGKGLVSSGFLVEEVTRFYTDMDLKGGRSYLATKDGKILAGDSVLSIQLMEGYGDQIASCYSNGTSAKASDYLSFQGSDYVFYCSQLEMLGVQSVYVLATPRTGLIRFVQKHSRTTLILLISIIAIMVVSIFSFVSIICRATLREMHLRASLIKQMEATEQAERKSMNKSLAFASASHDIRASLAGMTGLIEVCYGEVAKGSDLEENLRQMDGCSKDLLGLLNSILDTSKIEAGKMQLEEEEFNVALLLEDVVDLYHPMGAKKGTDVVLDPCDGSICKFSRVKGDRGKLRQVLCNLLSNAVKFTFDGSVSVRAWVRKPSSKNSIIASNRSGLMQRLSCMLFKNKREHDDLEGMNIVKNDPRSIELVFEVDDTGKGIPKEKQKEIFENYVQVNETAAGQGGTGLGLGIVQSLVRLMHGEIAVIDKDIGEKGSCFRFNVVFTVCENAFESDTRENEIALCSGDFISSPPRLRVLAPSPKVTEGSYVVLLIRNNERRTVSKKFMESLGIKVMVVDRWEQLPRSLKKIKRKRNNSSSKSDLSVQNEFLNKSSSSLSSCNNGTKDVPFSSTAMDGTSDYILSLFRKTNYLRGTLGFVLMVIDATAGPFSELCDVVNEFRSGLQNACCRVVWLANPMSHSINFESAIEEQMVDSDDIIKYKPFHGSRLYEVVRLLPEFGGLLPKREGDSSFQVGKISRARSSTSSIYDQNENKVNKPEIQELGSSISKGRPSSSSIYDQNENKVNKPEIQELGSSNNEAALRGKKILVAEDSSLLRKLAMFNVSKLGGTVHTCENGKEALELVSSGLADQRKHGDPISLPYDYILMDCEMPIMSGYEATEEIRKVEKLYGVHTPIIALTAHTPGSEEANKTITAGMDVYLSKPLKSEHLLEAIRYIHSQDE